MGEEIKKDVKLLLFLALALSIFNVVSVQFFLYDSNHRQVSDEFGTNTLPAQEKQQDFVSSSGKSEGDSDSEVYNYVNDKLKKYGYNEIESGEEESSNTNSGDSTIYLNGNSNQNQESATDNQNSNNQNSNEQNNEQSNNNNQNSNEQEEEEQPDLDEDQNEGDGLGNPDLPIIPPNDDGPPAEEIGGKVKFGVKTGFG